MALTSVPVVDGAPLVDPPPFPAWTGAVALTRLDCGPVFELLPEPLPFVAPLVPACAGAVTFTSEPVDEDPPLLDPPFEPT